MARIRSFSRLASGGFLALVLLATSLPAQQAATRQTPPDVAAQLAADRALLAQETYQAPPAEIVRLATAPRYRNVSLTQPSPDRRYFLKEESEGLPGIDAFGKPHYYFGGLQVDFKASRARVLTTRGAAGLSLINPATGASTTIQTPANATVSSPAWSPDGKQLAYIANFDAASQIYVADVATGKSVQVTRTPLLATLVTTIDWTADGKNIITVLLPDGRKAEPQRPAVAKGPVVRLWIDNEKASERNFASLLQDPYDMELLEYYVTGQLALIDVKSKAVKKIGQPAMIKSVDASPDGMYFRVTTMEKPFSYVVQYNTFGTNEEIWDQTGKAVAEIQHRPMRVGVPDTADDTGGGRGGREPDAKRGLSWMPEGPGMYYLEAVPGRRGAAGDSAAGGGRAGRGGRGGAGGNARPDRLVKWNPPFGPGDTTVLYTGDGPISDVLFNDAGTMIFSAGTRAGQGEIVAVNLAEPATRHVIVRQRDYTPAFAGGGRGRGGGGGRGGPDSAAFYGNPGALMTVRGSAGERAAMVSGDGAVFLEGTQYNPDWQAHGPQAFVDKIDIKTGAKTRVYEAPAEGVSETFAAALDDDFSRVIVNRESPTEVQDSYVLDTKTGKRTKLTDNKDYTPDFTNAVRKRVWVTRADGYHFLVNLTLPSGYKDGTRLPGMFWFYPYEYTDQDGYNRTLRTQNINRFPTAGARTIEYLITQGYAVANFDPPIVGETGRMNDNYVSDLVMNLSAVIDELDKDGYIDRARLGIGGHSYGAFSTMNAMVHTPFFKAGIAGDGMYNRSLTPTGFQSERRTFWSGQKTYEEMSPFFYADKLQGAILMYHSMEDQNVGTDPISSVRMMQALRAEGKTAALFMYPYEDHGPATRESDLDQWARWVAWLDIYVKHAGEEPAKAQAADQGSK